MDDVSTLVTDNEVLIVYNTDSDNRESTATQVQKMAESVVPGWFDIYTTDNTNLRKEIESYSTMDADSEHTHYGIDQLTSQMKKPILTSLKRCQISNAVKYQKRISSFS